MFQHSVAFFPEPFCCFGGEFELSLLQQYTLCLAGVDGNINGKVDDVAVAGVTAMEVNVLMLDGIWFQWLPLPLPLLPFGQPPDILCHNLSNLATNFFKVHLCMAYLTLFMKA